MTVEGVGSVRSRQAGSPPARAARDTNSEPTEAGVSGSRIRRELAQLPTAVLLVTFDDLIVRTVTEPARRLLDLPADQIVGHPVADLLDPGDRTAALVALEALRTGAIDFYRAHRHALASPATGAPLMAWVRAIDLSDDRYALIALLGRAPRRRALPTPGELLERVAALALTDGNGRVKAATVDFDAAGDLSVSDLLGRTLLPPVELGRLADLAGQAAARNEGVSVAYPLSIQTTNGSVIDLEAVVGPLSGSEDRLIALLLPPPDLGRQAELEAHLWRIAAEIEASGILLRAGSVPRLALARVPEAAALTPRQWEVLRRLMAGQRVPTIAAELFISQSTVRNHLAAIFDRFGVHSQPELLARLTETDTSSRRTAALPMA